MHNIVVGWALGHLNILRADGASNANVYVQSTIDNFYMYPTNFNVGLNAKQPSTFAAHSSIPKSLKKLEAFHLNIIFLKMYLLNLNLRQSMAGLM